MKKPQLVSTTQYYNAIADLYDSHLTSGKDTLVRNEVADFFRKNVTKGKVLDFGGGTGLDLSWLLESGYGVIFCEPAEKMREHAIAFGGNYPKEKQPIFLPDNKTDFKQWGKTNAPFEEKVSGILANFGVLNYVQDLPLLFEKFSGVLEENGSVIVNLLYASPRKLLSKYLKSTVKAFIKNEKIKTGSRYQDVLHETTLYSVQDLRKAAEKYFELKTYQPLSEKSDFLLLHFSKK